MHTCRQAVAASSGRTLIEVHPFIKIKGTNSKLRIELNFFSIAHPFLFKKINTKGDSPSSLMPHDFGQTLIDEFPVDGLALHPNIGDGTAVLVEFAALHHDPALIPP